MIKTRFGTLPLTLASLLLLGLTSACGQQDTDTPMQDGAVGPELTVYHDPNCGCCGHWAEHMEANGFVVETVPTQEMNSVKSQLGVPRDLPSCHTAVVGDYVIEGHVPAADVKRLLAERPDASGLSVPGMPLGSPGMEMGDRRMAYDVILFGEDGETAVFNHYEAIE